MPKKDKKTQKELKKKFTSSPLQTIYEVNEDEVNEDNNANVVVFAPDQQSRKSPKRATEIFRPINTIKEYLSSKNDMPASPDFAKRFKENLILEEDLNCSKLYRFLKDEYEKFKTSLEGKEIEEQQKELTNHMTLVLSRFYQELYNLFKYGQNLQFSKKIQEIAKNPEFCWMLAAYANRVPKNQLKTLHPALTLDNSVTFEMAIESFVRLVKTENSFFYKHILAIRSKYVIPFQETLAQYVIGKAKTSDRRDEDRDDVGSLFFDSLDPFPNVETFYKKPSFYDIENQPNLLKFYPYTSLDKIAQELKQDNSDAFLLLVADLQLKKFSVPHFCIMLKRIFVECANDPNFQKISSKILTIMGEELINDDRVMKLLSKTPQFFPILSKYIENLPPLQQGESFKDTYPIVHHFRHHTDFNLNLFRARKEAERNTNQTTNNASVVNHIFEHHLNKSCLSMSWWLGNKPTGARYQQVYEHVSTVVDTYSDEKTITVEKIIQDLNQEITDLSKGLMVLVSFNRRTALGSLITDLKKILGNNTGPLSTLPPNIVVALHKRIEEWKMEKISGSTKSNEELFKNGWKPTKQQMLLLNIETVLENTEKNKQSTQHRPHVD
jgi:hypothetical protein